MQRLFAWHRKTSLTIHSLKKSSVTLKPRCDKILEVVAPLPLEDFVAEVSRVWGESVTIKFRQDDLAREAIATSPTALACLTEVIREGVNNAIKHASASEISIDVFVVEPMLVEVTVVNPSQPEALSVSPGFGTDYLNNLTHDWSLTDDGSNTTLWAAVALDQS